MDLPSSTWTLSSSDNRDSLIRFWLFAPADQLEFFWSEGFGERTIDLVKSLSSSHAFTKEQIEIRTSIGNIFNEHGLQHPLAPQLMVANFLLSPPGLLTINNVESFFPLWLSSAYNDIYGVDAISSTKISSAQIDELKPQPSFTQEQPGFPDFGPFPDNLSELIDNRIHLNRILGLSNLYYIDPEDEEISAELKTIRSSLVVAIDNSPEPKLEYFWSTDFGDRYWSLVRSGIQKEPLTDVELSIKADVVRRLDPGQSGGFGTPGSLNAFLIAMMYFLPGTVQVDNPQEKIPSWLFDAYKQIFADTSKV